MEYLQKNPDQYLDVLKEGIWIPFVGINSIDYVIKLVGYDMLFDDEWEQKFEYEGFNIAIKDSLWISDTESFIPFKKEKFIDNDEVSYQVKSLVQRCLNS